MDFMLFAADFKIAWVLETLDIFVRIGDDFAKQPVSGSNITALCVERQLY